jgi:hypothetical protein
MIPMRALLNAPNHAVEEVTCETELSNVQPKSQVIPERVTFNLVVVTLASSFNMP